MWQRLHTWHKYKFILEKKSVEKCLLDLAEKSSCPSLLSDLYASPTFCIFGTFSVFWYAGKHLPWVNYCTGINAVKSAGLEEEKCGEAQNERQRCINSKQLWPRGNRQPGQERSSCGKAVFILGSAPCVLLRISVISAKRPSYRKLASNWTVCLAACRNCVLVWEMQVLCCFPFSLPTQQCVHHLTFLYSALISIKMKIEHTLRKNLSVKLIHIDCNLTHCKIFQARPGRQHVINLVCKFKPVSNSCYQIWIRQWQSWGLLLGDMK